MAIAAAATDIIEARERVTADVARTAERLSQQQQRTAGHRQLAEQHGSAAEAAAGLREQVTSEAALLM